MSLNINKAINSINNQINSIREKILSTQKNIDNVVIATCPINESKEKIKLSIKNKTDSYKGINYLVDSSLKPTKDKTVKFKLVSDQYSNGLEIDPLLCTLFGKEIEELAFKQLDKKNINNKSITVEERETIIKKYEIELWDLGVEEENLICSAENENYYIPRRRNADAKIILEYKEQEEIKVKETETISRRMAETDQNTEILRK